MEVVAKGYRKLRSLRATRPSRGQMRYNLFSRLAWPVLSFSQVRIRLEVFICSLFWAIQFRVHQCKQKVTITNVSARQVWCMRGWVVRVVRSCQQKTKQQGKLEVQDMLDPYSKIREWPEAEDIRNKYGYMDIWKYTSWQKHWIVTTEIRPRLLPISTMFSGTGKCIHCQLLQSLASGATSRTGRSDLNRFNWQSNIENAGHGSCWSLISTRSRDLDKNSRSKQLSACL